MQLQYTNARFWLVAVEGDEKVYTEQWIDGEIDAITSTNHLDLKPRRSVNFKINETGYYCLAICDRDNRPLFFSEVVFVMYDDTIDWSAR